MSLTELLAPVYKCEGIKRFKLEEKAVKILQRFIEQPGKYISLSAARKNLKSITSQEVFIIVSDLEKIGYLLGIIDKGRAVFKFNDSAERTSVAVPISAIEKAQQRFQERIQKKVERAAKTIERYKNLGEFVQIVEKKSRQQKEAEEMRTEKDFLLKQLDYVPAPISKRTALEIHTEDHISQNALGVYFQDCRFCQAEKGELNFG